MGLLVSAGLGQLDIVKRVGVTRTADLRGSMAGLSELGQDTQNPFRVSSGVPTRDGAFRSRRLQGPRQPHRNLVPPCEAVAASLPGELWWRRAAPAELFLGSTKPGA